jgi:predicted transcriptional regulator of viral defense system
MVTKNTILSKKDSNLLENAILKYGRIVSFEQLYEILKTDYSLAESKNRISLLAKLGWFIRIKRGLYVVVTDIGSLSTEGVSYYAISQALNKDSYISFENALQYHGMFDQMLSGIGAVTFRRARHYKVKDAEIRFFRIKKSLYFGFSEERSDIGLVNIASKEKALLDILYFRSNIYYASLVWEKLKENKDNINMALLKEYAEKFTFDVIRQVGFFLDRLNIETDDLKKLVKNKGGYSKMTKNSREFDSKWRLYFENSVIK